jgi:Domain of unknown function (DUF4158)
MTFSLEASGRSAGNPSEAQLEAFFTLEQRGLALLTKCRFDHTKLGMALQLCTLRCLGAFLVNPLDMPAIVVRFLERQLDLRDASLERYLELLPSPD